MGVPVRAMATFATSSYYIILYYIKRLSYRNEAEVGNAIKESGVARKDLWLTSKVRAFSSKASYASDCM